MTHWKRPYCWERLGAEEKGVTEDEMVGWYHQLNGHEFEQAPGDEAGVRQSMGLELDMTDRLNNKSPLICVLPQ